MKLQTVWNTAQLIFSSIGGAIGWWVGGFDGLIYALIAFTACDYMSGVLRAIVEKNLSSRIGARGIVKKVAIFLVVGVAHMADQYLLGGGSALRTAVVFFYCSNEGLSLLENTVAIGLPVPDKLKKALAQLHKKSGDKPENKNEEDSDNG